MTLMTLPVLTARSTKDRRAKDEILKSDETDKVKVKRDVELSEFNSELWRPREIKDDIWSMVEALKSIYSLTDSPSRAVHSLMRAILLLYDNVDQSITQVSSHGSRYRFARKYIHLLMIESSVLCIMTGCALAVL